MRRLLALAAIAGSLALPLTAANAASCGGVVDVDCWGTTCPTDCFSGPCTVWVDALKNPMTALCIG